jgi:hypothetical protein
MHPIEVKWMTITDAGRRAETFGRKSRCMPFWSNPNRGH